MLSIKIDSVTRHGLVALFGRFSWITILQVPLFWPSLGSRYLYLCVKTTNNLCHLMSNFYQSHMLSYQLVHLAQQQHHHQK